MYRILIVDEGPMDLQIAEDVLLEGLPGASIFSANSLKRAIAVMKSESVDLVILDVPKSMPPMRDFLRLARLQNPGLNVLLTSVMREEELLPLVVKFNAKAYLLKPFRPAQLLSAVRPLESASAEAEEETEMARLHMYLERLDAARKEYSYRLATAVIKEYLDYLYLSSKNITAVRTRIVEFADGIARLSADINPSLTKRLAGDLGRFQARFDLQGHKYQARMVLEGMLNAIFEEMEREAFYKDDTLKKVLNFIDRNAKKGVRLDDAAYYIGMSPTYFSKFFKKNCGVNFIDYVIGLKIEYAKDMLLDTDMLVSNIAYELSFRETNYFSKAFKQRVGMTPNEYRIKTLASKI